MRRQFHRRRLILQRGLVVEQLVDPYRQRERRPIQSVILEPIGETWRLLFRSVFVARIRFLRQHRVHFIAPGIGLLLVEQLRPAHLARDDLVALRMIEILLEQLHIFLRLIVLLL